MRKYNNPRLLNTVVSGTGMQHPVKPHVIVSDTVSEFVKGDLMDANAISELVDQKIGSVEGSTEANVTELRLSLAEEAAARTSADQTLDERITDLSTSIPQAISDGIAQVVAGADADYDTLKEISDYIQSDKTGAAQLNNAVSNNAAAIANEVERATGAEAAINDRIDDVEQVARDTSAITAERERAIAKETQLQNDVDQKANLDTTYTKNEVDTLINGVYESDQLANYYTKSEIDNAGYLTEHQDISNKADKSELFSRDYNDLTNKPVIPTVPTNVSAFTNDSNYQTQQLVDDRFTALINAAPAALDTLGEIATKLADNDDAVSAIVTSISGEVDAREAADTAITTNITELASTVSANNTAINNKVDALETSLEDRISDVEDTMPTKVSDLKNDSGLTLNTLLANEFYRASNRSMTGSVNTYATTGSGPYTMSNGSKYRVTVDDLDPEIVTSTMNGSNVRIESSQTVTYDSREFPIWYFETNPGKALIIAIWHGSESLLTGAITKSHDILIEELTQPTIDSKYIPSDFVNRTEFNQSVADLQSSIETKLPTATFDSTAVSHFENDSNYLTAKIPEWSVGDYLYSDKTVSSELDTNKTVIGVLVAPASHFDDGKARFVALLDGDTVTLEDIPTDYVYNNVVKYNSSTLTYDTLDVSSDDSKVGGFYAWGFKAPDLAWLDKKGNYVNGSYYYTSASFAQIFKRVVPAPYNLDGTKNTNYYSLGTNNILSILRETGDDWYIPTPREFGYLIYSRNIINLKISNAGGVQIEYSYSATPYATSVVVNNQGSQVIFGVNRRYGDFKPASTAITRLFIAIKQPTEYQFDVNGESVDVVTLNSISTVATTGSYNDLVNKPTIPAAQIQSDWNETNTSSKAYIQNKPVIPTVPTNVSAFQNDARYVSSPEFYANGHEYVEIGGIKWATMNVGATSAEGDGLYFLWGDTQGYTKSLVGTGTGQKRFNWASYKYSSDDSGSVESFTKYNTTDDLTTLDISDDAVRANWGGSWRMPTEEEVNTLISSTNREYTTVNGVTGFLLTDKSDNTKLIFMPETGYVTDTTVYSGAVREWINGSYGANYNYNGMSLSIVKSHNGSNFTTYPMSRCWGMLIRGVLASATEAAPLSSVAFSGSYNDLTDKPTVPDTSTFVTTNTDQTITGVKTFQGNKRIIFKQGANGEKLGFTLLNSSNTEVGNFEWSNHNNNKINNHPVFKLGYYGNGEEPYLGFVSQNTANGGKTIKFVMPITTDADSGFGGTLATTTTFYAPLGFKNGSTTVLADKNGTVDLSTVIPAIWTGTQAEYDAIESPSANTIYFIKD